MSKHFIKNIEIKNFKCFENFKAEGFGRVNLIGGKNNVGKTAFMEACYINKQNTSHAISDIIISRYLISVFDELLKEVGTKYIFNFIKTKADNLSGGKITSNLHTTPIKYNEDEINTNLAKKSIFLDTHSQPDSQIDDLYSIVIEKNLEDKVDNIIQNFDKNINKFRIIKSKPMVNTKNNKTFLNLNEFGDGLAKFITYILLLLSNTNLILFIDEIENGIHYTNLDKLWEIILTISKDQNVQVFATTHSKECIESYARVAKKLEDENKLEKEDIKFLSLYRNKENELKSITFDYEKIQNRIELGLDNR